MGISTTDLGASAALDEVLGNKTLDGILKTVRVPVADFTQQLAAGGPIAEALAAETTARAAAIDGLDGRLDVVEATVDALPGEVADLTDRVETVEAIATAGVIWTTQIVRVRSTANVNLATGLVNAAVLNGVALVTGNHVFLGSQTLPAENGLYTVVAAGAASRAIFADSAAELAHIGFVVQSGTVGTGERWTLAMAAADITLGTTALIFSPEGIEPGYAAEVQTARGPYVALNDRLDAIAETATGGDNAGSGSVITDGDAVIAVASDGYFRLMKGLHPDDLPSASSGGASTAYADGSNYLVSPNEMWSQWVWPRTIEDDNGNQMWGTLGKQEGPYVANGTGIVGRPGPLFIGYRESFSANAKKVLIGHSEENTGVWAARGSTDDHNRPAICLNPNPAAAYPLVAFQCDHNAKQTGRFWRSATRNPEDLTLVGLTPINGSDFPAYAQLFWNRANPAELRGAYRIGDYDDGIWSFFVADPATLPSTWTYHRNKIGGSGGYFLTTPCRDGSGMWLASHRHPSQAGSKRITLVKLNWDWSLVSGNGTLISADIRAEVSPVDVLDNANTTVIDTATGTRLVRLFDAREYSDGKVRFAYGDFPAQGKSSFAGDYKIATYDPATNTTSVETVCACGGMIQEEVSLNGEFVAGSGSSSYLAGVCLTDRPTEIVAARWWGTYGDLVLCTRVALDDWSELTLDRSAGKIARPEGHARQFWQAAAIKEELTSRFSYWRGSGARGGYAMFYNFNADRITVDLANFRSTFI